MEIIKTHKSNVILLIDSPCRLTHLKESRSQSVTENVLLHFKRMQKCNTNCSHTTLNSSPPQDTKWPQRK